MKASPELLKAIAVTSELTGTVLSEAAASVLASDLAQYPEHQVMGALRRCRRELKIRLTIADVVSRLDDGRPGPEEAWAALKFDEADTNVYTAEAAQAFFVALPIAEDGDMVAARMAFLETYRKACQLARDAGEPVRWEVSLGHSAAGREGPLMAAVEAGRLTAEHAMALLPSFGHADAVQRIEAKLGGRLSDLTVR